ncbi:hypothetical protein CEUSTIGMA_g12227.t1 [Chlamydomonas eustigma]|uniref:Uncharacterized protein n=1 Tax=Chlamydomonas eustigma TaxID=1157962 RepID=A0A250XP38_9CHLO|nr:hypothetical protein CEUSTIGMA_g12227.t1 [Chlamydomonas eustigma]|eukprot:GAX84806.1 hypothetical protein CEUSTIGMA_g12227.t1 [Chlamydomonas eustigma]
MAKDLAARIGLETQISLLTTRAVESKDPIGFLKEFYSYHNLAEYHIQKKGPLSFILLLSHEGISRPSSKTSSVSKLEPTAYVAIANRVVDSETVTGCASTSLANFYEGQSPCNFELAEGSMGQSLVMKLLDSLPMHTLFNLLGQGYKIVLSGFQLGGLIAHAMAAKLLLQVQQEIQMAEKMGINLSALSMTADKVLSFAFGSPLFANRELQQALASFNLHNNLMTFWKSRDASPAFFTLCCNLAANSGVLGEVTALKEPLFKPYYLTPGFKVVQAWASAFQNEIQKLPKKNRQYCTQPLSSDDVGRMLSETGGEDGLASMRKALDSVPSFASVSGKSYAPSAAAIKGKETSPLQPQAGKAVNIKSSVSSGAIPSKTTARTSASPAASGMSKLSQGSKSTNARVETSASHTGGDGAADSSWRGALREMTGHLDPAESDGALMMHPVGQFWLLETVKGSKVAASSTTKGSATAVASKTAAASSPKQSGFSAQQQVGADQQPPSAVNLVPLNAAHAAATSLTWLAESNKELFENWEFGLEEYQRDLIEAFTWTMFKTSLEVDGQAVDRKNLFQPTKVTVGMDY